MSPVQPRVAQRPITGRPGPVLSRIFRVLGALALVATLGLSGCGTVSKMTQSVVQASAGALGLGGPRPTQPDWKSLVVSAEPDANENSALAVDLVFVRDPKLVDILVATPAAKWFDMRSDTLRSFPEGLGVVSLELVPSQSLVISEAVLERQRALAVFVFAGYAWPGEHRVRLLMGAEHYRLQFAVRGFNAVEFSGRAP
jgi:type VI secretion system protein